MSQKAVLDRLEGEFAILILEDKKQMNFPKKDLPKGLKEGDRLQIEISGGKIIKIEFDKNAQEEAKLRIQKKLDSLRHGNQLKQ